MAANKHLDDGLQARAAVGQPGLRAADPRLPRGPRQLGPPDRRHRSDPRRTVTGTNGVETQVTVIGGEPAQRRGGRAPLRRPRLEVVSHRGQPSQAESRPPESGRRQRSASRPGLRPAPDERLRQRRRVRQRASARTADIRRFRRHSRARSRAAATYGRAPAFGQSRPSRRRRRRQSTAPWHGQRGNPAASQRARSRRNPRTRRRNRR